jgi:hypothetical protein
MPLTIDQEVRQFIRSPFDISKMSDTYKTSNGIYTFQSPSLKTIDQNFYYLLRNAREVEFEKKYKYKPDYLSYDQYGTVILDQLLMYVNGIFSPEDFDLVTVVIPTKEAIVDILPDDFPEKEVEDMTAISW